MVSSVLDRKFFRRLAALGADGLIVWCALGFSYLSRNDLFTPADWIRPFLALGALLSLSHWISNALCGVYNRMWRFTTVWDAVRVALAGLIAVFSAALASWLVPDQVPWTGWLSTYYLAVTFGFLGARVARRTVYRLSRRRGRQKLMPGPQRKALVVGAGETGQVLARAMEEDPGIRIVGFLDDDPAKEGAVIRGLPVLGRSGKVSETARRFGVDQVVFCMPAAPRTVFQNVSRQCDEAGVALSWAPGLSDVVRGYLDIPRLRRVHLEDLLERHAVRLQTSSPLPGPYAGEWILVTGAAGSIGSELVRQLLGCAPAGIVMLDRDENGLFELGREIREEAKIPVFEVVGDIRDRNRLDQVMRAHDIETVFHAAAYKHVPLMEEHPGEAVLNNVVGTRNLLDAARRRGVRNFVFISTDKAVNPSSIMGATKRVAERIVQTNAVGESEMRLCCVRFGNVLGSRASVIPVFQQQIAEGRNITVTHPEARRYFMTIPEAVHLVLQAGSLGQRGEIFWLDMGDPIKIIDLAERLIKESGLIPGRDIQIEFTGLRPGEKVLEELCPVRDTVQTKTPFPRILMVEAQGPPLDEDLVTELEKAALGGDADRIRSLLELSTGYPGSGQPRQQDP